MICWNYGNISKLTLAKTTALKNQRKEHFLGLSRKCFQYSRPKQIQTKNWNWTILCNLRVATYVPTFLCNELLLRILHMCNPMHIILCISDIILSLALGLLNCISNVIKELERIPWAALIFRKLSYLVYYQNHEI